MRTRTYPATAVVTLAAMVAIYGVILDLSTSLITLASPVNLTHIYHQHAIGIRADSGGDVDIDLDENLFQFSDEGDKHNADTDVDPPDDLASGEPVDAPADDSAVDISEYETDGNENADDIGDVDPDIATDPGVPEAESYEGPAIAGVLDPKVTRKGKTYSWGYTNLALKSLQPFGLVRDSWGGTKPNVNRNWVKDPKSPKKVVLQVNYPKGTSTPTSKWNPKGRKGGTGFYAAPISPDILAKARYVTFEYEVFFPSNFDFVKGGKLPGLWGGTGNRLGCSGGSSASDCFSLRFMFRGGGAGEAYLYVPKSAKQAADFCNIRPFTHCDPVYGHSVGRGSFTFKRGAWTKVKELVALNDPGKQNGALKVWANNKLAISYSKVVWRTNKKVTVRGIAFETFFGGSTKAHVCQKDERAYFRNFQMDAAT